MDRVPRTFGLITLFFVTFLVALCFAILRRAHDRYEEKEKAIVAFAAIGAHAIVEHDVWPLYKHVSAVQASGPAFGNSALSTLSTFPELTSVILVSTSVTDLARLPSECERLHSLQVVSSALTEVSIESLARFPRLQVLALQQCTLPDRCVAQCSTLRNIKALDLNGSHFNESALRHLDDLATLEYLNLSGTSVSDQTLAQILMLPDLENLELSGTIVTCSSVSWVGRFSRLRKLDLSRSQITNDGLQNVATVGSLEVLVLKDTQVTAAGIADIARLPNLSTLILDGSDIDDACLAVSQGWPKLSSLSLRHTRITDQGLEALIASTKERNNDQGLSFVDVRDTKVTATGCSRLEQAFRPIWVQHSVSTGSQP